MLLALKVEQGVGGIDLRYGNAQQRQRIQD
jgi:hypothetical protein